MELPLPPLFATKQRGETTTMSNTSYHGQRTAQTRRKNPLLVVLPIAALLAAAAIAVFALAKNSNAPTEASTASTTATVIDSTLVGTWVYDEYTRYEFASDGSGQMLLDDTSYPFAYSINGDLLYLDFADDTVTDATYTFAVEDNQLTLLGGEGTIGGSYELTKE